MNEPDPSTAEAPSSAAGATPLPPPAFPPGHRRERVHRPRSRGEKGADGDGFPAEAFYAPDAPIRRIEAPEVLSAREDPAPPAATIEPDEVARLLDELAGEVRANPRGRLVWRPGASPLEGALRGLLSGFLRDPPGLGRRGG